MQAFRIRDSRLTKERKRCAMIAHTPSTGPDLTEATSASRHPTDMEAIVETTTDSAPETSVQDNVVLDAPRREVADGQDRPDDMAGAAPRHARRGRGEEE